MKYVNCGCGNKYVIDDQWINLDFRFSKGVTVCNIINGLPFSENEIDAIFSCHMLEHFSCEQAEHFLEECHRVLKPRGIIRIIVPDLENICREYLRILELVSKNNEYKKNYQYIVIELLDQMTRTFSGGELLKYWERNENDEYVKYRTGNSKGLENKAKEVKSDKILAKIKNKVLTHFNLYREIQLGKFMLSGELHKWMYDSYSLIQLLENKGYRECKIMKCNESGINNWRTYNLEVNEDGTEYKPNALYVEAIK